MVKKFAEEWCFMEEEKSKKLKVCFICSSGGHYTELSKLQAISKQYESFLVTEKIDNLNDTFCKKTYFVKNINRREKLFIFRFLALCIKEFFIFLKEKPTHVITTGALCAYPFVKIAKIFRKKVIYIESYARVYDLSLTGKKIYKLADLFFVQWPELAELYPNAIYTGSFFGDK